MRIMISDVQDGGFGHWLAMPYQRGIMGGSDHGTAIQVGMGGGKPVLVSSLEGLVGLNATICSQGTHVYKGGGKEQG